MRKTISAILSMALCLNFSVCVSAEAVAFETSMAEEGGLVPTVIDESIEPGYTLPEENYTGAIPEETTSKVYPPDYMGGNEIVPAIRDDGTPIAKYLTMGDLYQSWFENAEYEYAYPDYVCGVWTETGDMSQLVVAVTKDEAGEKGKEEILSLIENDDSVKFTYQSYSYKELRQVQDEITSIMGDGTGIYGIGVNETENRLEAYIDITNPNAETVMWKFLEAYGDMIVFETGDGNIFDATTENMIIAAGGSDAPAVTIAGENYDIGGETGGGLFAVGVNADGGASNNTDGVASLAPAVTMEELAAVTEISVTGAKQDNTWIFAVCVIAVLVIAVAVAVAVNKGRAKQTTAGIVSDGTRLTVSDTERIVTESRETPERDVLKAVMDEIE